jgi:hypothetical protein
MTIMTIICHSARSSKCATATVSRLGFVVQQQRQQQKRVFSRIVGGDCNRGSDKVTLSIKPQSIVCVHAKGKTSSQYMPTSNMTFFARGQSSIARDRELANVRLMNFKDRLDDIGSNLGTRLDDFGKRLDNFASSLSLNHSVILLLFTTIVGLFGLTYQSFSKRNEGTEQKN